MFLQTILSLRGPLACPDALRLKVTLQELGIMQKMIDGNNSPVPIFTLIQNNVHKMLKMSR